MAFNREKSLAAAQKHLRNGKVERAIKEYEKVVDNDPEDVRSKLKLADLFVKANRFDDALRGYSEVAYSYAKQDFYEKAAAVYKQAMRIAPEDPALYTQLGEAYFRLGRMKDAIRVFHKAQVILKKAGNEVGQRDILERMVRIDPDDVGLRIQLAERYAKDNLVEDAQNLFRQAASQLKDEGRLDEYLQVAERMIFLDQGSSGSRLIAQRKEIVRIYLQRGDQKRALRHLQHCFQQDPQDIETLELLGSTFHRVGSDDKAVLVYTELAQLYENTGHSDRAESAYQTILNIDPKNKQALRYLGRDQPAPARERHQTQPQAEPMAATQPDHQVYEIDPSAFEDDALDGIEFLDDDDEPAAGDGFMEFAQEAIGEVQSQADFGNIEAYPDATAGGENTNAVDEMDIEEVVDIGEVELVEIEPDETDEIEEFLNESDVFLKYGLLDRAEEAITKVLRMQPDHLGGREQMRKLLVRMGDTRGAAHQLVEMARISRDDLAKSTQFLRQAGELVDNATLATLAEGAGVPLPSEFDAEFLSEVSVGLEEASSSVATMEPEPEPSTGDLQELGNLPERTDEHVALSGVGLMDLPDGEIEVGDMELSSAEEVEVDDSVEFDAAALDALTSDVVGTFDVDISAEDADMMFDELFGGGMDSSSAFDSVDPKLQVPSRNSAAHTTFTGSKSLTDKFESAAVQTISVDLEEDSNVNNSSLELGKTYKDMGLFSEAIEEFQHALEDPEASAAALYNIALCHLELGERADAQTQLDQLVQDESAPQLWRSRATEKLREMA